MRAYYVYSRYGRDTLHIKVTLSNKAPKGYTALYIAHADTKIEALERVTAPIMRPIGVDAHGK